MNRKLVLASCSILTLFMLTYVEGQNTFVPFGSDWKYSDVGLEPNQQGGVNWFESNYDDASWACGPAQLGYGDGDEAEVIGDTVLTAYFRHNFSVSNPSTFSTLDLTLLYDDGAVIYLNSAEIGRINMPTGPITYNTFASSGSSDNAIVSLNEPSTLVPGENIVAVEVHQRSANSSDISFDLKLVANPLGVVNIVRGPYLQNMSDTSVTVKWRTSVPTESVVRYGQQINQLPFIVQDQLTITDHEVTINGLLPNETYFYQIENDTGVLLSATPDLYFKMSPPSGQRQPVTAWILGDCGTKNEDARSVRDAFYNYIENKHTDLMLFLGDNAYSDGKDSEYQLALFENMYEQKLKNTVSWSCIGNHDGHSANSGDQTGPYFDIFAFPTQGQSGGFSSGTEAYYSFDHGNIHFISLDSYDSPREVGGSMYTWCESDLQNTNADWIVAFWHHPPYTKGSHNSDAEGRLIDMRQNFLPLLEAYGVDLVLSGHSHSYERSYYIHGHYGNSDSFDTLIHAVGPTGIGDGRLDGAGAYHRPENQDSGAVYITAGSSGKTSNGLLDHEAMFFSIKALGSCVLEVDGGELMIKFLRETGAIDDYFTITKELNCAVGSICDDGDICTVADTINALCQCKGTPISNPPAILVLDGDDAPLSQTFMATQSIQARDNIFTSSQFPTIFISPEVLLDPSFEVIAESEFYIMQEGCN